MPGTNGAGKPKATPKAAGGLYALLQEVERLESLAEDMEELGVATLADVRNKIAELHKSVDALTETTP